MGVANSRFIEASCFYTYSIVTIDKTVFNRSFKFMVLYLPNYARYSSKVKDHHILQHLRYVARKLERLTIAFRD